MSADDEVALRHRLRPGDLGMIVHLHGVHYGREHGLDTTFEPYVAKPLADFVLAGEAAGRLWLAERDGQILGSIAMVAVSPAEAQLRWFLLVPEARGLGLGRRLLEAALGYCRDKGFARVALWTFAELAAAISLYRAYGFAETERVEHDLWGARRTEMRMQLVL